MVIFAIFLSLLPALLKRLHSQDILPMARIIQSYEGFLFLPEGHKGRIVKHFFTLLASPS